MATARFFDMGFPYSIMIHARGNDIPRSSDDIEILSAPPASGRDPRNAGAMREDVV
jgi:hypothetical protein